MYVLRSMLAGLTVCGYVSLCCRLATSYLWTMIGVLLLVLEVLAIVVVLRSTAVCVINHGVCWPAVFCCAVLSSCLRAIFFVFYSFSIRVLFFCFVCFFRGTALYLSYL